jgi:hypothetical protein
MNARFVFAVMLAAGIAGCSGTGSVSPVVHPQSARTALARLVIKVPHKHARGHRARYVSPATASLAYSVDGVAQTAVAIAVSDPNCRVGEPISYLTCTVTLSLPPGPHTFSFTTLDASANVLSANTHVVTTIVAGAANTIPVTLGGVAASFALYPPNVPQVSALGEGGFAVYGKKALSFSIVPLDADGNAILGPGAPQPVVATTPSSMTMQTPAPSAPNQWTFTSTYAPADPGVAHAASLAISATPVPDSGGSTLSKTIPLSLYTPWIYVSSENGGDSITATDETGTPQTLSGTFPNLNSVNGIAYDPHNHLLYAENGGTPGITAYNSQGVQQTVSGTFQNAGSNAPYGIVFDPHNNVLYVTYANAASVAAFTEQGVLVATAGGFPNLNYPIGIAYDSLNHDLYVASSAIIGGSASITVYDEQGNQVAVSGAFPGLDEPVGIAYDSRTDSLYVTNISNASITAYDPQGNQRTIGGFGGLGTGPVSAAYDAHSDWFYVGDCAVASRPVRAFDSNGVPQTLTSTLPKDVPGITVAP